MVDVTPSPKDDPCHALRWLAHAQMDELHTVRALIRAMLAAAVQGEDTARLLQIVDERLESVAEAFGPHI